MCERVLTPPPTVFGVDAVLVSRKAGSGGAGAEGADLVPGSGLRWPPCGCGSPKCPDYVDPDCEICADLVEQRESAGPTGGGLTIRSHNAELPGHSHHSRTDLDEPAGADGPAGAAERPA